MQLCTCLFKCMFYVLGEKLKFQQKPNFIIVSLKSYFVSAESDLESTESDEEFQICEICNSEEVACFHSFLHSF